MGELPCSELSGPSDDTWWEFPGNPWAAYAGLPNQPQDRDIPAPGAGLFTVSFACPLREPVRAIPSRGQQADPTPGASRAFDCPFVVGGQGFSVYGEGILEARSGAILQGAQGSGWIGISGNASSISLVVDKDENFAGFTAGGVIPVPAGWAMIRAGAFASAGRAQPPQPDGPASLASVARLRAGHGIRSYRTSRRRRGNREGCGLLPR